MQMTGFHTTADEFSARLGSNGPLVQMQFTIPHVFSCISRLLGSVRAPEEKARSFFHCCIHIDPGGHWIKPTTS